MDARGARGSSVLMIQHQEVPVNLGLGSNAFSAFLSLFALIVAAKI